uniref:Uncharacterized protein n=2 Tax=Kalanchoe fedtschenkoi TaxID=63787 RepID=A0A7N0ZX13_KALFE
MSPTTEFESVSASAGSESGEEQRNRVDSVTTATSCRTLSLTIPSESFLKSAVHVKNQVVEATWRQGKEVVDPTMYNGLLGTAFICLRSFEATGEHSDLELAAEIADVCASRASSSTRHLTFLCGRGGVYAMGAVIANYMGDARMREMYLDHFLQVARERALPVGPEEGGFGMSYELLYGRAGFLWAALFLNKHLGPNAVPSDLLTPIVEAVLAGGRAGAAANTACPLMYRWHGTRYWGAANGLAGILHVLLHFPLSDADLEDVKGTLRHMISHRFKGSGNYPSSEGSSRDDLIQWSHGATGVGLALCKAVQVCPSERDLHDAAIEAGEVVWRNGLVKKVGLADGVAGNAYISLSLYRLTGDSIHLQRAGTFASHLQQNAAKLISLRPQHGPDNAFSLFQGLGGPACLWFDLLAPEKARFPGFEL